MEVGFSVGYVQGIIIANPPPASIISYQYLPLNERPNAEQFAKALFNLVNVERESLGEPALQMNLALSRAAKAYCVEMYSQNFFSHVNPQGKTVRDRMLKERIPLLS